MCTCDFFFFFVKIKGNSDAASIVEALAGDGEGHLVPTPVRREKIKASKRELALEADRVLKQADGVSSLHSASPPRRQPRSKPTATDGGSLQRKTSFGGIDSKKWNSEGESEGFEYNYLETFLRFRRETDFFGRQVHRAL